MSKQAKGQEVIRISTPVYDSLTKFKKANKDGDKDMTYSRTIEIAMEALDTVSNSEILYLVDGRIFKDVAEARGEAIEISLKKQAMVEPPQVVIVIGKDNYGRD